MNVIDEVLASVASLACSLPSTYAPVLHGPLPVDNGITLTIASGAPHTTDLDKGMQYQLTCALNGKHTDQKTVSDALNEIHDALAKATKYPESDTYQITCIETISAPAYIDRAESGQWLYGSSIRIKFYYRR